MQLFKTYWHRKAASCHTVCSCKRQASDIHWACSSLKHIDTEKQPRATQSAPAKDRQATYMSMQLVCTFCSPRYRTQRHRERPRVTQCAPARTHTHTQCVQYVKYGWPEAYIYTIVRCTLRATQYAPAVCIIFSVYHMLITVAQKHIHLNDCTVHVTCDTVCSCSVYKWLTTVAQKHTFIRVYGARYVRHSVLLQCV